MYLKKNIYTIETLRRFLYLNLYAFILLGIALIIFIIPLYKISLLMLLIQIPIALVVAYMGIDIIMRWEHKIKEYNLLIERNRQEFRPETFSRHMTAPCGRLLTQIVLKDLGYNDKYKELKKIAWPIIKKEWKDDLFCLCS